MTAKELMQYLTNVTAPENMKVVINVTPRQEWPTFKEVKTLTVTTDEHNNCVYWIH